MTELNPRYFQLYLKGNSLWPQRHLVNSFLLAAEATHPSVGENLSRLITQSFSDAQLNQTVDAMHHFHRRFNLNKNFDPARPETRSSTTIILSEVEILWAGAVYEAADHIITFSKLFPESEKALIGIPLLRQEYGRANWQSLKIYLQLVDSLRTLSPDASTQIHELLVSASHYLLTAPEFANLANTYRQALAKSYVEYANYTTEHPMILIHNQEKSIDQVTQEGYQLLLNYLSSLATGLPWGQLESE